MPNFWIFMMIWMGGAAAHAFFGWLFITACP